MVKYNGFKAKCQGFSHIKSGTVCQDSVDYYHDDEAAICVVSDGHGSDKYFRSDIGSKTAIEISVDAIKAFLARQLQYISGSKTNKNTERVLSLHNHRKLLNDLAGYIVAQWIDTVEKHWEATPCTDSEKILYDKHFPNGDDGNITKIYGTTLIIGVITDSFMFIIQIGDGAVCVIEQNSNKFIPQETIDESQFGGRTNSLSSSNCLSLFRFYYLEQPPKAIVVASDGVADSYAGNNGGDFLNFCAKLVELYSGNYEEAQSFSDDWLPQLSEKGSQDDMSIAGVYILSENPDMGDIADEERGQTDTAETE